MTSLKVNTKAIRFRKISKTNF